ncbi:transposase [Trichonephila inaurata madagascariensis]|uniref:Transposase n=1 Tax=Trichonephila inaurata madagascariensis TaxID=2747483 RepID=A0A8X7BNJ1_9ARAC|nr:transposase [Trichonephila inaurata madagascariensis]
MDFTSKGGFTTKIHALVDALGNPLKFILTPGQRHHITGANELVKGLHGSVLIADKGYDSNALIQTLEEQQCTAIVPPKKNRKIQRQYVAVFPIDHMDEILERNTHLAVRPAECEVAQDGVEYCGHVVGLGKRSPA